MKYLLSIVMVSVAIVFSSCFNCDQQQNNNDQKGCASACAEPETVPQYSYQPPEWVKAATLYEVNLRQYTKEGTIAAFEKELPRLKELGVDILWFMPIHPIGELNRKGELGSYYAVKDFYDVNPEFGTKEEFKALVEKAHEMGMHVIIDLVANHTAWDNEMTKNPGWYTLDSLGNYVSPFDWTDVIDLNYDNKEVRNYMTDMMVYWVEEIGIDGYRCDVAGMVPMDFWLQARERMDKIKPVFMLAEDGELPVLKNGFDANYAWSQMHLQNQVAKGEKNATDISAYLKENHTMHTPTTFQMNFTTNHDENSWNGTIEERLGDFWKVFAVYNTTQPGMPLIYSGQEVGNKKRLEFFTHDPIYWEINEVTHFHQQLNELKASNEALFAAPYGGDLMVISNSNPDCVVSFSRTKGENVVLTVLNFSDEAQEVTLTLGDECSASYTEFFSKEKVEVGKDAKIHVPAYGYRVFVK